MVEQCCGGHPCCGGDLGFLLLQINVICVLLFLIGTTALLRHLDWFDAASNVAQVVAGR